MTSTETVEEFTNRILQLRIPPNWKNVCISEDPTDYLQAIGYDSKGRIQYIYHPLFIQLTTTEKFSRLREFCKRYPKILSAIAKNTTEMGILFKILQKTYIRVGNEIYAKDNKTYGLTTLLKKHITISSSTIRIKFVGKKGKVHDITFKDATIAKLKVIS
jgi:DNA topoisomerase I